MRTLAVTILSFLLSAPLAAQQTPVSAAGGRELVDRVVAVVGDTVLLLSDVETTMRQMEAQGQPLPTTAPEREALVREIVDNRVSDLVILEAAKDAGVAPDETRATEQADQNIEGLSQQYGSAAAFDAALLSEGITRAQYRQILIEQYRNSLLIDTYLRQQMANRTRPLISEEQLRAAFAQRAAALGQRPARVSLQQVVVKTEPTDSARAAALRTAEQVMEELRGGADFEVLARRFSEDPGTKDQGGDLGWFRPGRMVPEFEGVAYALRPGDTSGIVKTDFGYHIIRLDRVRGAERKARHILITPDVTPEDAQRARQRADSVATAIRGGASPTVLARAYGTPATEAEVNRIPVDQLPPAYRTAVGDATAGTVIGPIEVPGAGQPSFAVVRVGERQEAGAYTLDDVRERLVESLQQQQMVDQLVEDLRSRVYVNIIP